MGVAVSKATVTTDLEKLKNALEKNSLREVSKRINEELDLLNRTTLDIAVTGVSGAGKSSLVNALRGVSDAEEGAAETGVGMITMEPKKYPYHTSPKVAIWDLPGIGTPNFQAKEYLNKTNFAVYDVFIVVSAERFTENNIFLVKEIQKMNKKYYFVRSKVDMSIAVDKRRNRTNFNEEETLEKWDYCCENLRKAGDSNPRVFLLSSWDLDKYDFLLLQNTLENELGGLKGQVMVECMPAFSREALEKKKAAMEALVWKVALVSCAIGAVPLPDRSLACDVALLVATLVKFCRVFGLAEESLGRLARRVGKHDDELKSAIKKAPLASQISPAFVIAKMSDLATQSAACEKQMAVEFVLKLIPALGSLVGGGASFLTTFYMLKSFLSDVAEDAENLRAKAVESKDA